MKKILFIITFIAVTCSCSAQIFNHKTVMDKFDDHILDKDIKTLIIKTDSTFVIEEKGNKPITYVILNVAEAGVMGDKEEIVNLVQDVYGYQECWCVVLENELQNYSKAYISLLDIESDEERLQKISKMIDDYCYYITHRVVTTQYSHQFQAEYYWVQKGDHNGRTIYLDR